MPALHRMPLFYLLATVAAAVAALVAHGHRDVPSKAVYPDGSAAVSPQPPTGEPFDANPDPTCGPSGTDGGLADDGILRTPDGLRRKVLVKSLDIVPSPDPGGPRAASPTLDYFSILFVLDERVAGDGQPWFRVGARDGTPIGWVPASGVLEWDTRLMARPTERAGRRVLVIYRQRSCLAHALAGDACPEHPDGCPIEGEEPAVPARNTDNAGTTAGFPILDAGTVDLAGGARPDDLRGREPRLGPRAGETARSPPAQPSGIPEPGLRRVRDRHDGLDAGVDRRGPDAGGPAGGRRPGAVSGGVDPARPGRVPGRDGVAVRVPYAGGHSVHRPALIPPCPRSTGTGGGRGRLRRRTGARRGRRRPAPSPRGTAGGGPSPRLADRTGWGTRHETACAAGRCAGPRPRPSARWCCRPSCPGGWHHPRGRGDRPPRPFPRRGGPLPCPVANAGRRVVSSARPVPEL